MDTNNDLLWIYGTPAVLLAIFVAVNIVNRRRATRITDFAKSRGWRCTHSRTLTGPGARFTIRPETGDDWELRVRRRKSGYQIPGKADFRAKSPRFPGEFVLFSYGGGASQGTERGMAAVSRFLGRLFGRPLMRCLYGADMGDNLSRLRAFEAPDGIDLAILATTDPRSRFDVRAISCAIHGMDRGSLQPSVRIGEHGLHVCAEPSDLKIPGNGEDFLADCLELRDRLREGDRS